MVNWKHPLTWMIIVCVGLCLYAAFTYWYYYPVILEQNEPLHTINNTIVGMNKTEIKLAGFMCQISDRT